MRPLASSVRSARRDSIISVSASVLAVVLGSMTGYGLGRFGYKFGYMRNADISFFFISQLILPPVVLALPFLGSLAAALLPSRARDAAPGQGAYAEMVQRHAAANGIPASLVHRVIMRESRYNPRAVSKGNYGMMQIRLGTARAMGYTGGAAGLLDPEVNMTYAVKYLAGAYKVAGGNESAAVGHYARGYYYAAKRKGEHPPMRLNVTKQSKIKNLGRELGQQ